MELGRIGNCKKQQRQQQRQAYSPIAVASSSNKSTNRRIIMSPFNTERIVTDFNQLNEDGCDNDHDHDNNGEEEHRQQEQGTITNTNNDSSGSATANSNSINSGPITEFDAMQHLIKGNLGPGCLNIPHAFALSGWVLGIGLFVLVAVQGIYSMILLVYCKQWIRSYITNTRNDGNSSNNNRQPQQQHNNDNDNDNDSSNDNSDGIFMMQQHHPQQQRTSQLSHIHHASDVCTFMDVAYASHGRIGSGIVQILLFVLQTGVCCVFLSLIATNLHASIPKHYQQFFDSDMTVFLVTLLLLVVVLVRDLKQLKWLSFGANCLMVIAVLTASFTAMSVLYNHDNNDNNNDDDDNKDDDNEKAKRYTTNPAAIATFVSSMFYSFEGIGLVMPIENSYVGYNNNKQRNDSNTNSNSNDVTATAEERGETTTPTMSDVEEHDDNDNAATINDNNDNGEELRREKIRIQQFVVPVLVGSTCTVAFLFLLIGSTCGPAFPNIMEGSVTAYLTTKYPNSVWYRFVNASVMVAVFCTFPLQLTPAMEVLSTWFGPGCDPQCCGTSGNGTSTSNDGGLLRRRRRTTTARQQQQSSSGGEGGRHTQVAQYDNDQDNVEQYNHCNNHNTNNNNNNCHQQQQQYSYGDEQQDTFNDIAGDSDAGTGTGPGTTCSSYSNTLEDCSSTMDGLVVVDNNNTVTNCNSNNNNNNNSVDDDGVFVAAASFETNATSDITYTTNVTNSCFGKYEWIFRRYLVVFGCSMIVLSVNDLGLLMSLFGAVGNTGLAAMPCIIHLRLMQLHVAPFSFALMSLDVCTIVLSFSVAITGVVFTLQEIL